MPRPSPTLSVSLVALLTLAGTALAAPPVPTPEAFTAAAARELQGALTARKVAGVTVKVVGPLTLSALKNGKDGFEISLERPWAVCRREPASCEAASAAYLSTTAGALVDALKPPVPPEPAQLRVVVRPTEYLEATRQKRQELVVQPLVANLWSVVVIDRGQTAELLRRQDLAALRLDAKGAFALALTNVTRSLGGVAGRAPKLTGQELGTLTPPEYYNCGLVPALAEWAPLAHTMKGPLLVSVPSDDEVMFADGGVPGAQAALTAATEKAYAQAEKQISPAILRWSSTGWRVVGPAAAPRR